MTNDNYVTLPELKNIGRLLELLNKPQGDWFLSIEVNVFDQNGEPLGHITMTDGGEYGFYPGTK